jgi:hypothetical protein
MNIRRSVCSLLGKISILSVFSPCVSSSVISLANKKKSFEEICVNLDLANLYDAPFHIKLQPGEEIKINFKKNTESTHPNDFESISFKMPLVSLKPYFYYYEPIPSMKLPFLVFSAKGMPKKAK